MCAPSKTNIASSSSACCGDATNRGKELSYLCFNFISGIAVTFINKLCFSRVNFGYAAALCNIHLLVTLLGVEFLHKLKIFKRVNVKYTDPNFIALFFVIGVSKVLNINSLKLNSIGFYQIIKLLVSPCVVLLEYLLENKKISSCRMILLLVVCFSVLASSRAALSFESHNGAIVAFLWIPFAAFYKVQWKRVKQSYNCSTLALMGAVLPFAICVQAIISPFVDPPGILDFQWTPEAIFWIGLSGIFAFLVNFSGFLVMGNISALAHVLLGQLKTAIIMIGATFLFGSKYTSTQLVGASGAVIAISLYAYVTINEKNDNDIKKSSSSLLNNKTSDNIQKNFEQKIPLLETNQKSLDLDISVC